MKVLSGQIGRALGRPSWMPMIDLGMRIGLGERSEVLLASHRAVPQAIQEAGYRFTHTDSGETLRELL
jgi:NAD dependent epimerase/dehydratase family enzyme